MQAKPLHGQVAALRPAEHHGHGGFTLRWDWGIPDALTTSGECLDAEHGKRQARVATS